MSNESADVLARRATGNLALLIRFAEGQGNSDHAGHDNELEDDAWHAIESLLIETRRDVERLEELAIANSGDGQ